MAAIDFTTEQFETWMTENIHTPAPDWETLARTAFHAAVFIEGVTSGLSDRKWEALNNATALFVALPAAAKVQTDALARRISQLELQLAQAEEEVRQLEAQLVTGPN